MFHKIYHGPPCRYKSQALLYIPIPVHEIRYFIVRLLYISQSMCFLTLNNQSKMKVFFKSSQKNHGPPCRYKSQAFCKNLFSQLLNKLNGPLPEYESRAP